MVEFFKERNLNNIKHALTVKENYSTKDSLPTNDVLGILKELGCIIDLDSFETNGWQYDWWCNFGYQEVSYTVCGCGYYGKISIIKIEEL